MASLNESDSDCQPGNDTMSFDLASPYRVAAGSVIFFGALPFVLFEYRAFPVGGFFGTLFGAFLMVLFQVVREQEAYDIIGDRSFLVAVFLILGVQLLAYFFQREEVFLKILRKVLLPHLTFEVYLLRVCALCFVLSVFLTGEVCCVMLTPVLLRFWEAQERQKLELGTLVLGIAVSCNFGCMVLVFSSLHMALVAAKTSGTLFKESQIDMRACIMYLLPVASLVFLMNIGFLLAHYKLRYRKSGKAKLVSEVSQSEQEMAGLTIRNSPNDHNGTSPNGHLTSRVYDGVYYGPEANQRSDDRISSIPCQLETILEDEILEISSCQSTSVRDFTESPLSRRQLDHGYHSEATTLDSDDGASSSSSDSNEEGNRMCNTDENLHQLNLSYRPGALQSQNLTTVAESRTSLTPGLDRTGWEVSGRWGVYRSLTTFSAHGFLPNPETDGIGGATASDSKAFLVCLFVLLGTMVGLLVASCYTITVDLGLVPFGAGVFAVLSDVVLNRRPCGHLVKQTDWSFIVLLFGLLIWTQGFSNSHILRYAWSSVGPSAPLGLRSIAVVGGFVILSTNILGSAPTVLLALNILSPCAPQRDLVLYTLLFTGLASNMTLFASVPNLIVAQKCSQLLKKRLSFRSHLKFGIPTSLASIGLGAILLYCLLLIDVPY